MTQRVSGLLQGRREGTHDGKTLQSGFDRLSGMPLGVEVYERVGTGFAQLRVWLVRRGRLYSHQIRPLHFPLELSHPRAQLRLEYFEYIAVRVLVWMSGSGRLQECCSGRLTHQRMT